jgi:curved DNA-binding protein
MRDPYETLGVNKNTSPEDIKKSFKKLAKKYHPDMSGGDDSKFKEINEAYDILKDPQKKQQYDLGGFDPSSPFNQAGFSFSTTGFDDIIKDFFQSGPSRTTSFHRQQMRNKDVKIRIRCTLEDIYFQTQKSLTVQLPNGQTKVVNVTIPVDANNNTIIRFKGLGDNTHGNLPPGNLMVHVKIDEHDTYRRDDFDLHMDHKISVFDVICGTQLSLSHISKNKIKTTIPELSQPTQTIRFKERGMPKPDGNYGDLYVHLKPYTPTTVNSSIKKMIKGLKDE